MSIIPIIYVACLAAYTSGKMHGEWIDCEDADTVREKIKDVLHASPEPCAEEYAIHDYEGFGCYKVLEYPSITDLCDIAELITEMDDEDLFSACVDCADYGADARTLRTIWEEQFQGSFDRLEDWAQELIESTNGSELEALPTIIRYSIDWEYVARELLMSDFQSSTINGTRYIFSGS